MAGGRRSKLTAEVQQKICAAARTGNSLVTAAALAGIGESTLHEWLRRGAHDRAGVYREFARAVEEALADAHVNGGAAATRATKLTPELQQKICDAIRAGNHLAPAAAFAGVDTTTLYDWIKRGARDGGGVYHEFAAAVEKANADAEVRAVALVTKAASAGGLSAATYFLERRFPERWGRRDRLEATVKGGITHVNVDRPDLSRLTDEELNEMERLYAKTVGSEAPAGGGDAFGSGGEGAA